MELLRKVTVKIGLERIDIQEGVIVEALLDSEAIGLVISLEFARKQGFKLKKRERPIYVRNVDGTFNKKSITNSRLKSELRERTLYWVNIRELNRVLDTMYPPMYTN